MATLPFFGGSTLITPGFNNVPGNQRPGGGVSWILDIGQVAVDIIRTVKSGKPTGTTNGVYLTGREQSFGTANPSPGFDTKQLLLIGGIVLIGVAVVAVVVKTVKGA